MDLKEREREADAGAEAEAEDARGSTGMHSNELQGLKKRQINISTSLRYCGTKSLSSPQTLSVVYETFQHFDLLQLELRYFSKNFLV
jgi:hypothetical protein